MSRQQQGLQAAPGPLSPQASARHLAIELLGLARVAAVGQTGCRRLAAWLSRSRKHRSITCTTSSSSTEVHQPPRCAHSSSVGAPRRQGCVLKAHTNFSVARGGGLLTPSQAAKSGHLLRVHPFLSQWKQPPGQSEGMLLRRLGVRSRLLPWDEFLGPP